MPPLKIHFSGLLQSPASWAHVGRCLATALIRTGAILTATNNKGFLYDSRFPLEPALRERIGPAPAEAIHLVFEYPPKYPQLRGRPLVGLLTYESTRLPRHWVEPINRCLDLLVVPSRFVRELVVASGVSPQRVVVIPYGYDPGVFTPARPGVGHADRFVFLTVAAPHRRKGVREVLEAFQQAFSPADPVQLVVKTTYVPGRYGPPRPWEETEWSRWIEEAAHGRWPGPPVVFCTETLEDAHLAGLYAQADAVVQASWGEGFGLAILEAMACARPVIVTGWGGHLDYVRPANAYLIDYELAPAGLAQYDSDAPDALLARPKVEHLAQLLRQVYADPREADRRGRLGRQAVQALTWDHAAQTLVAVLQERFGR